MSSWIGLFWRLLLDEISGFYFTPCMDRVSDTTWLGIVLKSVEMEEVLCYFDLVSGCLSAVTSGGIRGDYDASRA